MKTFAQLSAVGIAAVLLLKLLGMIVVPGLLLAAAFAFGFKLLLIAAADGGDRELVWNRTSNGVTEPAATQRPDYIVDNTVVMSEIGALGAGSSSPEMRANQPPAITLEGPDVRETSMGRPVTITVLVEAGLPKRPAPSCSSVLRDIPCLLSLGPWTGC